MTDNPIKLPVSSYLKSFTLSSKSDGDYVLTNMESFTFVKHTEQRIFIEGNLNNPSV